MRWGRMYQNWDGKGRCRPADLQIQEGAQELKR